MHDPLALQLHQNTLHIETSGRGFFSLDRQVTHEVRKSTFKSGFVTLFCRHTSCSLLIQENADPRVQDDLMAWFLRVAPDGDPAYTHRDEGPDDMPAHIRTAITQTSLQVPIVNGELALGTWQSIYLVEHRVRPHRRRVVVQIVGI